MIFLAQAQTTAGSPATQAPLLTFTVEQVLSPYVWVFITAFIIALLATPIMRMLALKNGIVDWPDLKRKQHLEPVAYLGGVAVFLGWIAAVMVAFFLTPHNARDGIGGINFPLSIVLGVILITLVGLFDDVYGISPRVKLGGQLLAAAFLASQTVGTSLAAGLIGYVGSVFGFDPSEVIPGFGHANHLYDPSYWLGALLVAFLVLTGCNASNLLDGLDGLASGVTSIVALGFTAISVYMAAGHFSPDPQCYSLLLDPVRLVMCLALLGAVLGFLPYNFNPATIFMGDTGSMLLGFLCISTILLFAEKAVHAPILIAAGLTVFALPLVDTSLAIVRRKSRGQPIFSADNQHLHHQLIHSGMTVKQSVITLYVMALGFAGLGFAMVSLRFRFVAAVFLVVVCFVIVTTWKVGHRQYLRRKLQEQEKQPQPSDPAASDPATPPAQTRDESSATA